MKSIRNCFAATNCLPKVEIRKVKLPAGNKMEKKRVINYHLFPIQIPTRGYNSA